MNADHAHVVQHLREEPASRAGAGSRARRRRCTGRPASTGRRPRGRNGPSSSPGEQYRKKYQDESTNVSIVSVSRSASPPHDGTGHVAPRRVARQRRLAARAGSRRRRAAAPAARSRAPATSPHVGQWMIGIGAPQYRWREISQSRSRNVTAGSPRPSLAPATRPPSRSTRASGSPSNGPELTITPSCGVRLGHRVGVERLDARGAGSRPGPAARASRANSKSRWSCAGTPMTAPVPYSIRT